MTQINHISKQRLTQSQFAIWTGQQLATNSPLYNTIYTFDIDKNIDPDKFKLAFKELVNHTDVLRTIFYEENGTPIQSTLPEIEYNFDFIDFSNKTEVEPTLQWVKKRSVQKLELSKCIFDVALIKINTNRFIWFLNIHHIITDAISFTILHKKQFQFYINLLKGDLENVKALPAYNVYVNFENEELKNDKNNITKEYWKNKVNTILPLPKLYGKENTKHETAAKRIHLNLGAERSKLFKALLLNPKVRSLTPKLTLFNLFSTILFVYINRISNQKTIAIGAPAHNRTSQLFKETPGLFIEIFPLILELENDDTFYTVLQKSKLEVNNYLRHGQPGMSTEKTSRSFNVILNFITSEFQEIDDLPMKAEWVHPDHNDSAHHLRCHIYDFNDQGNLEVDFDFNTAIFDTSLLKNAPKHFLKIIDAFLADSNQTINTPPLITDTEKNELINSTNVYNKSEAPVVSQFEEQILKTPNAIAIRHKGEALSYSQLNAKANQFANYLIKQGVSTGDSVAIHLERSTNYVISVLSILKIGGVFVPIASDQPLERIKYILQNSNSKALITNTLQTPKLNNNNINIVNLDDINKDIENEGVEFILEPTSLSSIAYAIYTSGSTGKPKGVLISNSSLAHYINWAKDFYAFNESFIFPLCTSIGFDLTITATFLPLVTGGELIIYTENTVGPDLALLQVIEDNLVNSIKLTPSHLSLLEDSKLSDSNLKLLIVGGEDFKSAIASTIQGAIGKELKIYNEYGPTEATVGCIISKFNLDSHLRPSVPIGKPIANMAAYILDSYKNLVPKGVVGELYVSGTGLANGYLNNEALTNEKFLLNPFATKSKMYRTGDLARYNEHDELEFLGRADEQIKLNGFRIELSDIEANLANHPDVENASVVLIDSERETDSKNVIHCKECGLPSSYPNIDFDANDVCHLCNSFKGYKEKTDKYFKTENDLKDLLNSKKDDTRKYDCLSLLSGGKDSTYVLARLIDMGLRVLTFTLDNGYISDQAKANITRITEKLGVDHIYGETPHMNKIFVDSLHQHKNVCNGCFKTIYTLSTKVALENEIPFVVTGLSRGQFFETRLTEELFWDADAESTTIDDTILEARKLYHQEEDAVKKHLDTSMFNLNSTFEKVQYVDFYRYSDVSLTEMLRFLKEKAAWVRPTDTGRSTNCLINQAGIHVHKKEKGYSNYSFPYSWDVRLGHKNRDEALEEINEEINVDEVNRMLDEIGYKKSENFDKTRKQLVGFYTSKNKIPSVDLKLHLAKQLPDYMLPVAYKHLEKIPLTNNGKVDKKALRSLTETQLEMDTVYAAPTNEIEELVESVWKEVLQMDKIGINDNFIALGGHSLAAIRVTARINDELETSFSLNKIFELPTIKKYAAFIEAQLIEFLNQ